MTYIVKVGDTLSSIAARHGIDSWKTLYHHPANSAFRAKRPNPNLIFPGDQIQIPSAGPAPAVAPGFRMAIIDGTGEADDDLYQQEMQHSFCRQLGNLLGSRAHYIRGPSLLGRQVKEAAVSAKEFLLEIHRRDASTRLMLAGYSRGGSAAIMAAEYLDQQQIAVDSLFLFDAVARHEFSNPSGEVIPANVGFSFHARRELNALLVLKYEGTVATFGPMNTSNPMRPSFGNTGLTHHGNGIHEIEAFTGSHGALGGVGWGFVAEDPACQAKVAAKMSERLQHRGVMVELKSKATNAKAATVPTLTELVSGWAIDLVLMERHRRNLSQSGKAR